MYSPAAPHVAVLSRWRRGEARRSMPPLHQSTEACDRLRAWRALYVLETCNGRHCKNDSLSWSCLAVRCWPSFEAAMCECHARQQAHEICLKEEQICLKANTAGCL